jgi:putative transposase
MVPVRAPRVNDKRVDEESGERKRFSSRSCQRTPGAEGQRRDPGAVLAGLSAGAFRPALGQLLGEDARPRR